VYILHIFFTIFEILGKIARFSANFYLIETFFYVNKLKVYKKL